MIISAGILPYHKLDNRWVVLLGHPGGPYYENSSELSIIKGEAGANERLFNAAKREFLEETGVLPNGEFIDLGCAPVRPGKINHIWAVNYHCDISILHSNSFSMEWPKGTGVIQEFPEIDRYTWISIQSATKLIFTSQLPFLYMLEFILCS
jgi:predicted NUDIX family NTP pyrophosphohydrolase